MTTTTIDFDSIKKTQRAGWETGDYTRVGYTLQIMAERLVEAADVRAGQMVLDELSMSAEGGQAPWGRSLPTPFRPIHTSSR